MGAGRPRDLRGRRTLPRPRRRRQPALPRGAGDLHPARTQRRPAGQDPRDRRGVLHPPRLPRRRSRPAHPRRDREQGAGRGRRRLAGDRRPDHVQGQRHGLGVLQHRPGEAPHPRAGRAVREPSGLRPRAPGSRDRRRRPGPAGAVVAAGQDDHPARRATWSPTSSSGTDARRPRPNSTTSRSGPPWRRGRPSTSHAPSPSSVGSGRRRPTRCWDAAGRHACWPAHFVRRPLPVRVVDEARLQALAANVVSVVQRHRSWWQPWHVRAEALRQVRMVERARARVRSGAGRRPVAGAVLGAAHPGRGRDQRAGGAAASGRQLGVHGGRLGDLHLAADPGRRDPAARPRRPAGRHGGRRAVDQPGAAGRARQRRRAELRPGGPGAQDGVVRRSRCSWRSRRPVPARRRR